MAKDDGDHGKRAGAGTSPPSLVDPIGLWTTLTAQWLGFMTGFTNTLLAQQAAQTRPSSKTPSPGPTSEEAPVASEPPSPQADAKSQVRGPVSALPEQVESPPSPGAFASAAPAPHVDPSLDVVLSPASEVEPAAPRARRKTLGGLDVHEGDALVAAMTKALTARPEMARAEAQKPPRVKPAARRSPAAKSSGGEEDLRRIKGIGGRMAAVLRERGITRLEQLAGWDAEAARAFGEAVKLPGRVERENWIGQAKALLAEKRRDGTPRAR